MVRMGTDAQSAPVRPRSGRVVPVTLMVIVGLLAWVTLRGNRPSRPELVNWSSDYQQAAQLSADTGKLLLVNFTTAGCGACDSLKKGAFGEPAVADFISAHFVPVRLDLTPGLITEVGQTLVSRYQINAIPVTIATDSTGNVLARRVGATDAQTMLEWLRKIDAHANRAVAVQ